MSASSAASSATRLGSAVMSTNAEIIAALSEAEAGLPFDRRQLPARLVERVESLTDVGEVVGGTRGQCLRTGSRGGGGDRPGGQVLELGDLPGEFPPSLPFATPDAAQND